MVNRGLFAVENSGDMFCAEARSRRSRLADCPTVGRGPSACRPRLTGEVADGGSGNGFECGLFLWVPKDMGNLFWLVDLTCMKSTKL